MDKIKSISKIQIVAGLLIVIGLAIMIPKGLGMLDFRREAEYAHQNNFEAGNPSPDLLRPWMTVRYISAAYGVPQKYLFEYANIRPGKETSMLSIKRLNGQHRLGEKNGQPQLLETMRQAIIQYRANPVVTGLIEQEVEDWMTIQYISNSTGIPMEEIFKEIGIPQDGHAYQPLGFVSDQVNYPGGPSALNKAVQKIVDARGVKP
jgi:hypothetical protein